MAKEKYLYCITKGAPRRFKTKGLEGKKIYIIDQEGFSVVVSDAGKKEFLPSRENLTAHQKVVEEILKKYTVLPISFGTVAEDKKEVRKLLKDNTKEISETLKKIEGKIELGLKVFWQNMPAIFKEIIKENKEIQRVKSRGSAGRNVLLMVGEIVAKALERKKDKESALILNPLLKIAEDSKKGELLRDDMILNANFLVARSKEKDFDGAIDELDKIYDQRVKFKYIGPIPPANFINLRLKM